MNEHISVSVLTPVFRVPERILRRTLESLAAQTLRDAEFLIVDDGSQDAELRRVLEEFAARDGRFKVFIHERNRGRSHVRNAMLDRARGEFVTLLDGDDLLAPNYCEVLLAVARYYGADMVTSGIVPFADGEEIPELQNQFKASDFCMLKRPLPERTMARQRFICRLFRRSALRDTRFDETIYRGEDVLFIHEAMLRAGRTLEIAFPGYFYRTTRLERAGEPDSTPGEIIGCDPVREEYRCAVAVIEKLIGLKKYCRSRADVAFLRYFALRRFLRQTHSARKVHVEPLRSELRREWCRLYSLYANEFGRVSWLGGRYDNPAKRNAPGWVLLGLRGFFELANFRYECRRRLRAGRLARRKAAV